tara:strand:+ start:299 stop:730 length:432 start_codon:yes stop_codon:yes gene_type:complete
MSKYTNQKYHLHDTFNERVISGHRTLNGALVAQAKHDAAVRKASGKNSYIPTAITQLIDGIDTVIDEFGYSREQQTTGINKNCLQGVRCPSCKQEHKFYIHSTTVAQVTDQGPQDPIDIEWNNKSHTLCPLCKLSGPMKLFKY